MAKNLFEVVQNLFVPFILLAIVSSVNFHLNNKKIKDWHWIGIAIISVIVLLMSILRQWRFIRYNQINNIYLLSASLILGLLYCVGIWLYFSWKNLGEKAKFIFSIVITVVGLIFVACLLLFKVPTVIFLPLQFLGIGESVFTTMYLLKCTGFLLGWLVCILMCLGLYKVLCRCEKKSCAAIFSVMYILNGFISFVSIIGIINSYYRRKIKIPTGLRKSIPQLITAETVVYFVILAVLLVFVVLFFIKHTKLHGEYENPAQHRLLRRFEKDCRKWSVFVILLASFSIIDLTVIKNQATKLVELSPSEEFQIEGNRIFIPLEQVSDGHLHRFSWDNSRGKVVRFIIVQKQGTNFGIGFDACEVCGNVGYYERKNEVVCNRCDVVMNKNTIGLKGGCNPIPLESEIQDGGIVIYTEDLDRESGRF